MLRGSLGVLVIALAIVLSGCAGRPAPSLESAHTGSAAPAAAGDAQGSVEGTAVADDSMPVAGVQVSLAGVEGAATTGPDGAFAFPSVPSGFHKILAQRLGYKAVSDTIEVRAGDVTVVTITLAPVSVPLGAFASTTPEEGYLACSVNPEYAVSPCGPVLGEDRNRFPLAPDPTGATAEVLLELTWTPSSAAGARELELSLCLPQKDAHVACAADDLGGEFRRTVSGPSPLALRLSADELPLEETSTFDAWVGAAKLGGPVLQQRFTLYVTFCQVEACPGDFSAVPE